MDGLLGEINTLQEMKQHHHELMAQEQNRCREGIAEERQYAQLQQRQKGWKGEGFKGYTNPSIFVFCFDPSLSSFALSHLQ